MTSPTLPAIYAFDVDQTLEVGSPPGPVTLDMMRSVKERGDLVGINGNWSRFMRSVPNWPELISFYNMGYGKAGLLIILKATIKANRYVMVGNDGDGVLTSADKKWAEKAGWTFIDARDFKE